MLSLHAIGLAEPSILELLAGLVMAAVIASLMYLIHRLATYHDDKDEPHV